MPKKGKCVKKANSEMVIKKRKIFNVPLQIDDKTGQILLRKPIRKIKR